MKRFRHFSRSIMSGLGLWVLSGLLALPGQAGDLTDLSIEELLEIEIDQLSITGIHHTHQKGEWMLGYDFMHMGMKGNLDGTTKLSTADVFARGYMVSPTSMSMNMHMLHLMYGITDDLTVMGMMPFHDKSMDHVRMADGREFTTEASGLGDLEVAFLYNIFRQSERRLTGKLGVSTPTGSIDEVDAIPDVSASTFTYMRLPYPMQLGTGTWDITLGLTYLEQREGWQLGFHVGGIVHTGRNDNDYRVGDEYDVSGWYATKFTSWSSGYLKLKYSQWFDYTGADPSLNPAMVPTADPDLRAGKRLDLIVGANLFESSGRFAGFRLGIEGGAPIYQSLDGPQLRTTWMIGSTLERTF